jgi:hypothetical protein
MTRLLVPALAVVFLVAGCGGSESYQTANTAWESCVAHAPVGPAEPAACTHLATEDCQAVAREHLKGTGTGLSCEAAEGKPIVTTAQLRSALTRCVKAWNATAGQQDFAAVAQEAYRSHRAAVEVYVDAETTYVTQFGTGFTDKTADLAVSPGACIVFAFGSYGSYFVQQSDGSWLEASSARYGPGPYEAWGTTEVNANAGVISTETLGGFSGGTLYGGNVGGAAIQLTAERLHGFDYVEALIHEKEHRTEAKPSAAECAGCQPSSSEAQTLPRPVGFTRAKFEEEKANLRRQAAEAETEQVAECERGHRPACEYLAGKREREEKHEEGPRYPSFE